MPPMSGLHWAAAKELLSVAIRIREATELEQRLADLEQRIGGRVSQRSLHSRLTRLKNAGGGPCRCGSVPFVLVDTGRPRSPDATPCPRCGRPNVIELVEVVVETRKEAAAVQALTGEGDVPPVGQRRLRAADLLKMPPQ
jgi:hypothetical protein